MNRIKLALIATVALAFAHDADANPDRADRVFGGARDWFSSSGVTIRGQPAAQIAIEARFLVIDTNAVEKLGVDLVITGATVLAPAADGTTSVYRTRADAATGFVYTDTLFGQPINTGSTPEKPVGLGFLYGDQILIDVRLGADTPYDPTAIDSNATISDEFEAAMGSLSESGFGLPRPTDPNLPTQVLISDGDSLLMGFQSGMRAYRDDIKFPLLSDVPVLGPLFLGTVSETDRGELIVHITPTILTPVD